ncbi:hypothetical protein BB560_005774 [Smittium megazygosporum]|uniref:Hexosyltransferase n=1 Tax=Smittium megazygosporum TaxID=133381 RepID=A0A2T9YXG1_9FUNG|nr:hypothetical protein BB560_005774 [Smittium megazygosporum]
MIRNKYLATLLFLVCCIILYINTRSFNKVKELERSVEIEPQNFLSDDEFKNIVINDKKLKIGNRIKLPDTKPDGDLYDLKGQYHIMVPMSSIEDIKFFKSFYNDLETETICDLGDDRDGCDSYLDKKYNYYTLKQKTRDLFQKYCSSGQKHKLVAKMDYDAIIIDKQYFYKVLKFMMDNSDKPMYYGNPFYRDYGGISMGGNFYALNQKAMEYLCSCKMELSDVLAEDLWFGDVINNCTISKNLEGFDRINYIFNDQSKILHKNYNAKGVSLKLGRNINNKNFKRR